MSSGSFRRVDYSIRPAKHAERRMIAEIFRRLRPFGIVEDYVYVGLGSIWFADFVLFHRSLGIRRMISIEKNGPVERFDANKPFAAIQMSFGETGDVLPKLEWDSNQFIWLDYDDQLDTGKLQDAVVIATRASSGTVFACSVQCHQAREVSEADSEPGGPTAFDRFKDKFGVGRIPQDSEDDDLYAWRFSALSRKILLSEIESALSTRNIGAASDDIFSFKPICSIDYEDGAKMTTLLGVFFKNADQSKFNDCGFENLDFLKPSSAHVKINIPKLTVREIRRLEQLLPFTGDFNCSPIPQSDAKYFSELYRYLPNFAVLET